MIDLKTKLIEIVKKIDFIEVVLDVENFLEDKNLIEFIKSDGKSYILERIENL